MYKKFKAFAFIAVIVIIVVFSLLLSACKAAPVVTQLGSVEVRQYQGQNLSATADVLDNAINGLQNIDAATYRLGVTGLVANTANYTYDEVTNNFTAYKKVVTLNCVEGWKATILWQGVQVKDILALADPLPTAKVVIFHASDGYTTSLPIEYIENNSILMAYKMNDAVITPEKGFPFMLVAENKWGYKWIKWITGIELSDNINYKGYWEERGYSNDGSLSGNQYEQ